MSTMLGAVKAANFLHPYQAGTIAQQEKTLIAHKTNHIMLLIA